MSRHPVDLGAGLGTFWALAPTHILPTVRDPYRLALGLPIEMFEFCRSDSGRFRISASLANAVLVGVVGLGAVWTRSGAHGGGIGPYLMMLGVFHLLEFWGTAVLGRAELSFGSFAFNGVPYATAIALGLVEFTVRPDTMSRFLGATELRMLGIGVACGALCLRTWAVVAAKTSFNHVVQTELSTDHRLVTTGPYRWLRHPSYSAYYWFAIAGQLILLNPITLCVHAFLLGRFFRRRLEHEEQALVRRFGTRYTRFCEHRLLLIPGAGHERACSTTRRHGPRGHGPR